MSDGRGYDARLAKTEDAVSSLASDLLKTEDWRFTKALEEIIVTMGLALVEKLNAEDWAGSPGAQVLRHDVRLRAATAALVGTDTNISMSPLAAQFTLSQRVAIDCDDMKDLRRPLVMPPEVSAVYLSDHNVVNAIECLECHYLLPLHCDAAWEHERAEKGGCDICGRNRRAPDKPPCQPKSYFRRCPLCNGELDSHWGRKRPLPDAIWPDTEGAST